MAKNTVSKAKKKVKKKSVKHWKRKAWDVFSKYIRSRDSSKLGCRCYTCERYFPINKMHAGHYISRKISQTFFNEINVNAQCVNCNSFKFGDLITYRENLVKEYGEELIKELESQRNILKQWKAYKLEDIYKKYKAKLKEY